MKTSFKQYKRPFKCTALPRAGRTPAGAKAKRTARSAAHSGRIEQALERLTTTTVQQDGMEKYLTTPRRAKELLADALLYEEKAQARRQYAARKTAQGGISHQKWGLFPVSRNGKVATTPIEILARQGEAEQRAVKLSQWGQCEITVRPMRATPR